MKRSFGSNCLERKNWSAIELELDRNWNGIGSVIDDIRIGSGPDRNRKNCQFHNFQYCIVHTTAHFTLLSIAFCLMGIVHTTAHFTL